MAGGKGKSTGGKAGPKEAAGKTQKSASAKAGLQVRFLHFRLSLYGRRFCTGNRLRIGALLMATTTISTGYSC